MNNPDQETVLRAIEDARRILGEYTAGRVKRKPAERGPAGQGWRATFTTGLISLSRH
jgi:hypothetical protein